MPLVEKRYAEAMIGLAGKNNALDLYQKDLGTVASVFTSQSDFSDFMLNPQVDIDAKKALLKRLFEGGLSGEVLNLVMLLLDKSRIKFLPGISEEYVKLADELRNTLNISVTSAAPLDQRQLEAIADKFRKLFGALSVKTTAEVDSSLIGGVMVTVGDKLFDGTVRGRLKGLEQALVK